MKAFTWEAEVYADGSWARTNATLADGNNTYTATAEEAYSTRTAQDSVDLRAEVTFQYDGNRNQLNEGWRVFEYDYENQLTNVYASGEWRSSFKYDAFGRRRVCQGYSWSGSAWALTNEVHYVYDGNLVLQERDGNNIPSVTYTRSKDISGSLEGAGGIGGLLARTDNSQLIIQNSKLAHAYYHADGNGNVTALIWTNQLIAARYHYDSFGNILSLAGLLADANLYRFSSREIHLNSGLVCYRYRFYDPNLQRWLNRDPIHELGGFNLYAFCLNSPVGVSDAFGLRGNEAGFPVTVDLGGGVVITYTPSGPGSSGGALAPGNNPVARPIPPPGFMCLGSQGGAPILSGPAQTFPVFRPPVILTIPPLTIPPIPCSTCDINRPPVVRG